MAATVDSIPQLMHMIITSRRQYGQ